MKKYKYKLVDKEEDEIKEQSTTGGVGGFDGKYGFGASLGKGPPADKDGVKDNYYVKGFAFKLVPKNKDGSYVQKGSGLEVRQLFK